MYADTPPPYPGTSTPEPSLVVPQQQLQPPPAQTPQTQQQMYNVVVPAGVGPGQTFQANVCGVLMNVVCPEGVQGGMEVQIPGPPSTALPTDTDCGPSYQQPYAAQQAGYYPGAQAQYVDTRPNSALLVEQRMAEETVVSPLGWFICIVGCFICPPCNLLGLCIQERRLVPVGRV
mmetsp:Transcript_15747/g.48144  ORF Transcript_15747/g.48144 Transcript_15747/m.48144 type:complete len:175 (-) Transcript_15747:252-776(-)